MKKTLILSLGLFLISSCKPIGDVFTDFTAPSGSISINSGAGYTTSTLVTLTLNSSDSTQMYVTNVAGCESGGSWEAYSTIKSWTLGQTNQTATVYVKFKDRAQNVSSCQSDTIVHDNTVPTLANLSVTTTSPGKSLKPDVKYNLTETSGAATVTLYSNSNCTTAKSGGVSKTAGTNIAQSVTINLTDNAVTTLYAKAVDAAANASVCTLIGTYTADNTAPSFSSVSITPTSSNTSAVATAGFTLNEAGEVTLYDGSGCSSAVSSPTQKAASAPVTMTTNALTAGTHQVYAKAVDSAGNESTCTSMGKFTYFQWYQEAYLKASNADTQDYFGYSASISGDTIVVGAFNESSNQTTITNGSTASGDNSMMRSGAAYVFKRVGSSWAPEAYIKAPNPDAFDNFGTTVSISGDTIVVGVPSESSIQNTITNGPTASSDNSLSGSGAAYVFKRAGSNWVQEAYLKAPNAMANANFGSSASISGDTIVVGAYGESSETTITNGPTASNDNALGSSGAAYVFKRSGSNWAQEAYLKAPNAGVNDYFGFDASISGDTIVVGANGESSSQTTITNGSTASSDNSAQSSGAAYVFKRTGSNWAQEAYLKAPNADANDNFGHSASISGDRIVVGSYGESSSQTTITNGSTASSDNSLSYSGAAYVFKRSGSNWAQEAYLKAPNAGANDYFGASTSISGDTILVSASGESSNQTTITNGSTASSDDSLSNSGAVYVFKRTGSNWAQEAYLKAPNADAEDSFEGSLSISGDTTVIGVCGESSNQTTITNGSTASSDNSLTNSGAAYVVRRHEVPSTPTVSSVTPASGAPAGDNVIIFGSGFMKSASVTVGGASCATVTIQGPNEIICNLPTKPASGALDIVVTNPNSNGSSTLSSAYTYP